MPPPGELMLLHSSSPCVSRPGSALASCVLRSDDALGGQGARDAALEREAQLAAEKARLKAGLGTALEQKALVESQLAAALAEQHALRCQVRASCDSPVCSPSQRLCPHVMPEASPPPRRCW